jgi:hypothetical protein
LSTDSPDDEPSLRHIHRYKTINANTRKIPVQEEEEERKGKHITRLRMGVGVGKSIEKQFDLSVEEKASSVC